MYELAKAKVNAARPVVAALQKNTPVTYIGAGTVKQMGKILATSKVKRVLILTDAALLSLGLLDSMLESIKAVGIEPVIFDGVRPDPTFSICDAALELYKEKQCDAVVAFGGGSCIDSSKAVAAAASNNCSPRDLDGLLKVKKELVPFIAVPTTSGTGSEVTYGAVISDDATHDKKLMISPRLVPKVAILDPELTTGLPPHITSATALDALTHALEAYTNTYTSEETDAIALKAINLICNNILEAYKNPKNLEAREALMMGSFYAGMAITRAYVGYAHAFAHNIGGTYGIPHGLACGVLLPHVMDSYMDVCKDRFAYLAEYLELVNDSQSVNSKATVFIDYLYDLNNKLGIPARFEKFPKEGIPTVLDKAFAECHGMYPVPRYYTKAEALNILNRVCAK